MNGKARAGILVLAGFLTLSPMVSARAADYTDLDESHWAYEQMTRAVDLGILQGIGGNQLAPSLTMTWGQFLAMTTRAFVPDLYQQAQEQGLAWDTAGYAAAAMAGILRTKDGLSVTPETLSGGITREDAAVLLYRALPENIQAQYAGILSANLTFTDSGEMDAIHQVAVYALSDLGISTGKPDGSFGRPDPIQRCDGTVLLMRTLDAAEETATVPEVPEEPEEPEEPEITEPGGGDYWTDEDWLTMLGENPAKHQLLFGDTAKRRFDSLEEAQANMVTVTVTIWRLSNGVKSPSTATLQVHTALADDIVAIFTEIYNDPEQFPMNAPGCFRYVEGTTGEHNCGTAIDINANENYQIRDGQVLAGSLWEPDSNPYSIAPDSSVVRIFAEHGWSWGGDAWAYDSDDSQGYHDYMHFSYMGG